MTLVNESSGVVVCNKTRVANNVFSRFKGLMFELRKNFNYCLIFELPVESIVYSTIHMLFVFFPIDVVFLNKRQEVVDIVKSLKPWTLSCSPKKSAKYFIELPEGKSNEIRLGQKLSWR